MFDLTRAWRPVWNTAEPAAGGAPDNAGAPPSADPAPDAAPPPEGARWWEDAKRFDDSTRSTLEAKGLTVDDPLDAMAALAGMYRSAEQRLGKPADSLMEKPQDGKVADWLKANGAVFGIPEAPDGYKIDKPDTWPKDAPWDDKLEAKARELGHTHGLTGDQMGAMVGLFAEHTASLVQGAEQGQEQAQAALRAELQRDWGDQFDAKTAQAQQAFAAVAEAAGLDEAAKLDAATALIGKTGDGNVMRLFAALGDMMGEDTMPRIAGGGGAQLGMTPAEARAELAAMEDPDSEYAKATAAKRQGRAVPNWAELTERRTYLAKLAAKG